MKGAINIVSKHCGGPTRDCELVSLSPRAERGPDTDIPLVVGSSALPGGSIGP